MRLIDADALLESICQDECERSYKDCDYTCSSARPVVDAPSIEAVPLKPLAEWLAEYCTPICPPPPDAMLAIIDPARPITFTDITNAWEKALQTKIWEDDND